MSKTAIMCRLLREVVLQKSMGSNNKLLSVCLGYEVSETAQLR